MSHSSFVPGTVRQNSLSEVGTVKRAGGVVVGVLPLLAHVVALFVEDKDMDL